MNNRNKTVEEYVDQMIREQETGSFQILFHQVMHLTKVYTSKLLKDTDLHPSQVGILFLIQKQGELSQKELATYMNVTPPSMTVAIQKLEKNEYVTRKADENDQRIMRLRLAPKGVHTLERIQGLSNQVESVLFQNMSIEEQIILRRLLMQVKSNLIEQQGIEEGECHPPFPKEVEYE